MIIKKSYKYRVPLQYIPVTACFYGGAFIFSTVVLQAFDELNFFVIGICSFFAIVMFLGGLFFSYYIAKNLNKSVTLTDTCLKLPNEWTNKHTSIKYTDIEKVNIEKGMGWGGNAISIGEMIRIHKYKSNYYYAIERKWLQSNREFMQIYNELQKVISNKYEI